MMMMMLMLMIDLFQTFKGAHSSNIRCTTHLLENKWVLRLCFKAVLACLPAAKKQERGSHIRRLSPFSII